MNIKTILIVDDSPTNIDILDDLLHEHRRQIATNGKKAIEMALSDEPPDLILLDIEMPKMNGFEACEVLKSNPRTKGIPVIFLTSKTDKETTIQGFELGASDFVTKPFNPAELTARVKTQLNLADAQQKLEATIRQLETSSSLLKQSGEDLSRQNVIADRLLRNILPEEIARELKESGQVKPRHFSIASVLFADLVGFSKISRGLSPKEIVDELNTLFVGFDLILEKHRMEKIKTIGDGYMAAGGLPSPNNSNPVDAVSAGLEIIKFVNEVRLENEKSGKPQWQVRVGVHTGELIAGVIGKNKFVYDIWGDTVNAAARMESAGEPGRLSISGVTYQLVKDKFKCVHHGQVNAKNMGKMDLYFCEHEV